MAHHRVQVVLRRLGLLPEDDVVNTFHFSQPTGGDFGTEAEQRDARLDALLALYASLGSLNMFSNRVANAADACVMKCYDLEDPKPRPPVEERTFTMNTGTGALPAEVAICASFQGFRIAGVNQARRRGRVFLGPLASSTVVLDTSTGADARVNSTLVTGIAAAFTTLKNAEFTPAGASTPLNIGWAVYSPTTDVAGSLEASLTAIHSGWVDNTFDTQRRRGQKPSTRTVF